MKKILLIFCLITAFSFSLFADHINGANISYSYLGNNKYEITITAYRDCNNVSLSNTPVVISCNSGSISQTLPNVSVKDVTGIPTGCLQKSRCVGAYSYGFEEHKFKGVIDVSSLNCCELTILWEQCCRNTKTSTINIGPNVSIHAKLNKCVPSSLVWNDIPPQFLLFAGKDHFINFSIKDTLGYDSIVYSTYKPESSLGGAVSYAGSFTQNRPITFLGFPNQGLLPPAGFHLDAERGNISFRPTKANEIALIGIEATAWRKINGVTQKVGYTRSEYMPVVISQSTTRPTQMGRGQIKTCGGDTSVALIDIGKITSGNTVEAKLTHNFKWAKTEWVNVLGATANRKTLAIFFVADTPMTNAFTLDVSDNACPVAGRSVITYSTTAGNSGFTDTSVIAKTITCNSPKFWVANKKSSSSLTYFWAVEGKYSNSATNDTMVTVDASDTGWIKATLYVSSSQYCNFKTYSDSIYISALKFVSVNAGQDTDVCYTTPTPLLATPKFGTSPYTYKWSNGQSGQAITVTPALGKNIFTVEVTDANGCKALDKLFVYNFHPDAKITGLDTVCLNTKFTLYGQAVNTSPNAVFGWQGVFNNNANISDSVSKPKTYTFIINDNGCYDTATWQIQLAKPTASFITKDSICVGTQALIKAQPYGGKSPYSVFWDSYNRSGNSVAVSTTGAAIGKSHFFITITDSLGCKGSASSYFTIMPLPAITISPIGSVCQAGSIINLNNYVQPIGGNWAGSGVNNNLLNPTLAATGINTLAYTYTDSSTQCANTKIHPIKIYAKPVIGFVADSTEIFKGSTISFTNTTQADTAYTNRWEFLGIGLATTAKNTTATYTDTGHYSVKLWVNDGVCPPDSVLKTNYIWVKAQPLNIGVIQPNIVGAAIYPNPAKDILYIRTDEAISTIKIFNSIGSMVAQWAVDAKTEQQLNVSGFANGVYFITITAQNGAIITQPIYISQ